MKTKLFLILSICAGCFGASAQAYLYSFTAVSGAYVASTGGTVVSATIPDSYTSPPITFVPGFVFAGVTYNNAYMTSNGLLTLGGTTAPGTTIYNGILNTTGSGVAICPFNADQIGSSASGANPQLRFETIGNEHVFQWTDNSRYPATTDRFSYQVRLNTTTGVIKFVYDFTSAGTSINYQPVVGIRSGVNDYKNILVTSAGAETWAAPLPGATTADVLRFTTAAPAKVFNAGQTYIWTPPTCPPPAYANLTVTPTYSSGLVTWTAGGNEALWIFGYAPPTTTLAVSTPSYLLNNLPPSTDYSVRVRAYCGVGDTSVWTTIRPFRTLCLPPSITSITSGSLCVTGTLSLNATTQSSASINWYTSPTGGAPTGTNMAFVTPTLTATTNYYATAIGGAVATNVGFVATSAATSGAGTLTYGLYFDALTSFQLQSVVAYPYASTAGTPGTITVNLIDPAGNILQTGTYNVLGYPQATALTPQVLNLNFSIPAGTNYRLVLGGYTGLTGVMFQPSGAAIPYPYTVPGVVSITAGTYGSALHPELYYYFYNWQVLAGCESPRSAVTVTVNQRPTILAVSSATGVVCAGTPVNLVCGGNATSFTWTPSGGNASLTTVTPNTTTTYTISAELAAHCATTKTLTVAVNPKPAVSVNADNSTICGGELVNLTASGNAISYSWYPDGGINSTAAVSPTASTTYVATGTDALGCTNTGSINISVNATPALAATASKTLACQNEAITLFATTNASSFVWSNSSTSLSTTVTPQSTTVYSISASNGTCTAKAYVVVTTDACTGLAKQSADAGISIYPNPASDAVTVTMPAGDENTTIRIFDVVGKLIVSQTLSHELNSVNVSTLEKGVYFFRISTTGNDVKTGKLVKQ